MPSVTRAVFALSLLVAAAAGAVGSGNDLLPDVPLGRHRVRLEPVADVSPSVVIEMTHAGDDSGRLFLVSPDGVIRILDGGSVLPTPFLDAPAEPADRAMSGLAFHPDFATNRRLYVITGEALPGSATPHYFPPQTDHVSAFHNVLVEYETFAGNPDQVDPSTRRELLRIHQPHRVHNVNDLVFGDDGFLYIAVGDGGATRSGSPTHYNTNGPDTTNPYGAILRIDVDQIGSNGRYAIPPGNPFASGAGGNVPEIYAWGLRNPWRISKDRETGDLYTGSNGDLTIEQIYRIGVDEDYAWDAKEGSFLWNPATGEATVDPAPDPQYTPPLAEYDHNTTTVGFGSVIGGFVYRGSDLVGMQGLYLFNDLVAGALMAMDPAGGALTLVRVDPGGAQMTPGNEFAWGEDEAVELYVSGANGVVLRLTRSAAVPALPAAAVWAAAAAIALTARGFAGRRRGRGRRRAPR
ncbi:MAG: PQQ-dependent sugar dehydrogenase [Myxococcota bacterium]